MDMIVGIRRVASASMLSNIKDIIESKLYSGNMTLEITAPPCKLSCDIKWHFDWLLQLEFKFVII